MRRSGATRTHRIRAYFLEFLAVARTSRTSCTQGEGTAATEYGRSTHPLALQVQAARLTPSYNPTPQDIVPLQNQGEKEENATTAFCARWASPSERGLPQAMSRLCHTRIIAAAAAAALAPCRQAEQWLIFVPQIGRTMYGESTVY